MFKLCNVGKKCRQHSAVRRRRVERHAVHRNDGCFPAFQFAKGVEEIDRRAAPPRQFGDENCVHYRCFDITLADDDLAHIQERRRPENRLGFALQLCALRYPGRTLTPGEIIPHEVLSFIGTQLGVSADALLTYATRRQTHQEHMGALREVYGYKTFAGRGARDLRDWLFDQAEEARSNEDLAQRLVAHCRETQTILPAISTIERLCADALVAAERRIETRIAEKLDITHANGLMGC